MKTRAILALTAVAGVAAAVNAQGPALEIRFSNGTNAITVLPNASVPVQLWAVGLPAVGTQMNWTTFPGTGQAGSYAGFASVLTNLNGSAGTWQPTSPASIAPPFVGPPFGNPGVAAGSNVTGINIGVGFNPPVTGSSFLLWTGTIDVGNPGTGVVNLATTIQPVGAPPNGPNTGFEVQLSGILGLNVSHFIAAGNATGVITIPAPASLALLGLGGLVVGRRRR